MRVVPGAVPSILTGVDDNARTCTCTQARGVGANAGAAVLDHGARLLANATVATAVRVAKGVGADAAAARVPRRREPAARTLGLKAATSIDYALRPTTGGLWRQRAKAGRGWESCKADVVAWLRC